MKLLFALGTCVSILGGATAAPRAFTPPVFARPTRPLGGVPLPTLPSATGARHARRSPPAVRYVAPVYYVPNTFDPAYDYPAASEPPPPPPQLPSEIAYGAPVPPPSSPGDPIGPEENYYLIAYKNHTIYPALAYWLEGETLHYVTTRNTHNQASLDLIDLDKTAKLNADRALPFSLPGK